MTTFPRNKKDVGYRLAAIALNDTYGREYRGVAVPHLTDYSLKIQKQSLRFRNTGSGLMTPDKYGYLRGFEIAGSDQKFFPARAFVRDGKGYREQ